LSFFAEYRPVRFIKPDRSGEKANLPGENPPEAFMENLLLQISKQVGDLYRSPTIKKIK